MERRKNLPEIRETMKRKNAVQRLLHVLPANGPIHTLAFRIQQRRLLHDGRSARLHRLNFPDCTARGRADG